MVLQSFSIFLCKIQVLTYFLTYRVVTHQALELAVVAMTIIPPYELLAEGGD